MEVRVGAPEMARLFSLKENLDHADNLVEHLESYRRLGWGLVARTEAEAMDAPPLGEPADAWLRRVQDLSLNGVRVDLEVHTGSHSQLLVLEVPRQVEKVMAELGGHWQAACVAELADGRSRHFYFLPAIGPLIPSQRLFNGAAIFGENGLALLPPSQEASGQAKWRWVAPPWDNSPGPPGRKFWNYLMSLAQPSLAVAAGNYREPLSWQELYCRLAPHEALRQAFLTPAADPQDYHRRLLGLAVAAGLLDEAVLRSLLWHAPHSRGRSPEHWQALKGLVAQVMRSPEEFIKRHGVLGCHKGTPDNGTSQRQEVGVCGNLSRQRNRSPGKRLPMSRYAGRLPKI